jgi:hypothetical protein
MCRETCSRYGEVPVFPCLYAWMELCIQTRLCSTQIKAVISIAMHSVSWFIIYRERNIKLYRTVIEYLVLCECETWCIAGEGRRILKVFEKRELRVFGSKRENVTSGCGLQRSEKCHNLYAWVRCFVGQISWPFSHPWYSPASLPDGSGCWIRLIRNGVVAAG